MAKCLRAANDLVRLLDLSDETRESEGRMTFPIAGHVRFDDIAFAYPSRPDVPVLKGVSFEIQPGETVGIVGCVSLLPIGVGVVLLAHELQLTLSPSLLCAAPRARASRPSRRSSSGCTSPRRAPSSSTTGP